MFSPLNIFVPYFETITLPLNFHHYFHRVTCLASFTLQSFGPLLSPGRAPQDHRAVDCNDEDAHFLEARVDCPLSDLVNAPEHNLLNKLIPEFDPETIELALGSVVLIVQVSLFSCGGIAVAASPSHKLVDSCGYYHFLQTWAAIHRGDEVSANKLGLPRFNGASVLTPREEGSQVVPSHLGMITPIKKLATKRFVFDLNKIARLKDLNKIARLKAKIRGTYVELVTGLILRNALAASRASKPETAASTTTMLSQTVSFWNRIVPAVETNVMGNWMWSFQVVVKQNETDLTRLVANMRKEVTKFIKEKAHRFKGEDGYRVVIESLRERGELFKSAKGCVNFYRGASLCKLPIYEINFGWGKPMWVTSQTNHENLFVLIDTKHGDGVEVWVTLDEEEMVISIFEREEELLSFAYSNPSALIVNSHSHSRI